MLSEISHTPGFRATASRPPLLRYGVAVLAVLVALLARWLLQPVLGDNVPFLLFFPAIMIAAWFGGLGAGLLATALSALAATVFFLSPVFSLAIGTVSGTVQIGIFSGVGAFISLLSEGLHQSRRRAETTAAESLRQKEETLRVRAEALESDRQEQRSREELETMNRIGRILAAELDLEKLVQALTDEATAVTRAQFGAFFYNVTGPNQESYTLYTLSGVPREAFSRFPMPRNTHVFGPTFRGEGIVRSDDITKDPRYGKNPPYRGMPEGHLPVRSYLAAPVMSHGGEVLGGLFFGHSGTGVFTDRDERILAGIAGFAAVAIDNANLYREAREAKTQAEEANRAKDDFLATVSHELRTPLNAMMGWGQILLVSDADGEKRQKGLETIVRNGRLQAQLIDDLLDVSRIITGKMRLDVRPVELVSAIDAAIESIRPAAEAKKITLLSLLDPLAGPVAGDPARLQQVVWNLLANAIKFTPKGGKVEVRLERVNSHVEIIVADNGIGIGPEFLPHVFDRFRQLDNSIKRQYGGLGLGLAIVRHLAELHGGTVRVKSPGEGQGSTFVVMLPVSVAYLDPETGEVQRIHPAANDPDAACKDDPALDLKGIRVLVVEDEPDARETLRHILEHCDAEVWTVASAAEALDELARFKPHVLLSDIGLPGEDGYSLIRRIRSLPPEQGGKIPAAALTAFARGEDRRKALMAGFQMHLAKPVDVGELAAAVATLAKG
jgi:signal transduction histidine kinase/CheY-like chemotaxis protein